MKRAIPRKNEAAFLKWERAGKRTKLILWASVLPLILLIVFMLYVTPEWIETVGGVAMVIIVVVILIYAAVPFVVQWCVMKPRLSRLSKDAAIFAALVAAEDIERGNSVRASLAMGKLLWALSDFLGQRSVALGTSRVAPGALMKVTPERIPKRAVFRAVQADEKTKDFQGRLRDLAVGLAGDVETGYLAVHRFLGWLAQKTEGPEPTPEGLLEKRPLLKILTVNLGPVIIVALGGIIAAIIKLAD